MAEVLEYSKDEQLERLYQRTAWVFDEKYKRPGYGAYDAFKQAVSYVTGVTQSKVLQSQGEHLNNEHSDLVKC